LIQEQQSQFTVSSTLIIIELEMCGQSDHLHLVSKRDGGNPSLSKTLEKEMATHLNMLPWRIPWTERPGRVQSMVLQRVRHKFAT